MPGEQQGPDTSLDQENYKPTTKEILKAESQMDPEQRAQSNVRQIFIESEHRILDLPLDLVYKFEGGGWGADHETISGTFDGQKLELRHGGHAGRYYGTRDGQELPDEEVKSIWTDIHPVVLAFEDSRKSEKGAKERVQEEIAKGKVRPEDIGPYEKHQHRIKDKELAHEIALKEKQKMDETRQLLDEKIEQMELEDNDKEFINRIKEEVIKLSVLEYRSNKTYLGEERPEGYISELPKYSDYDRNGELVAQEIRDEYNRQKELIFQLLGVEKEKVQEWVRGFAYSHPDSDVYDTMFPDIILRENINTEHRSASAGRHLYIERNSRYQKAAEK